MSRTFSRHFSGDPKALVERARQTAAENDADFRGDEAAGTFSGHGVAGSYTIEGQTVHVTLERKPFFASWSMVEQRVGGFFS